MIYNTPESFLHDLQKGIIPIGAVSMEQFLLAHAWVAVDNRAPRIKKHVMVAGGIYEIDFQVQSVKYPEEGRLVAGGLQ